MKFWCTEGSVPPSKLWNSFAIPNAGVKFSWIMVGTPSNKYRHHYMWFDDHMKKTLVIDLDYLSVSFGGDWIGFSKQNLYWPLPHDSSSTHDSAAQVAKAIALAFGKAGHWHFTILESIRVHESIEALYVYIYICVNICVCSSMYMNMSVYIYIYIHNCKGYPISPSSVSADGIRS